MSEILIHRIINKEKLFKGLSFTQEKRNIEYTNDQDFITHMYDVRNFDSVLRLNEHITQNKRHFKQDTIKKVRKAFLSNIKVVNKVFEGERFKLDLEEFLSDKKNNELRADCIWNVALFYNQIYQIWYRPIENTFFGFLNQNLTQLHENIEKFVQLYLIDQEIQFEMKFNFQVKFSSSELKELNAKSHSVSIGGRLDIYNPKTMQLFEIKASGMKECSQEWIIQTLTYATLLDIHKLDVKEMIIVNVLQGNLDKI